MSSGTANVASIKLLFCDVALSVSNPNSDGNRNLWPRAQIKRRGNINVYHGKLRKKIHLFIIFFLISLKNYQTVDRFNERVQKGTEKNWILRSGERNILYSSAVRRWMDRIYLVMLKEFPYQFYRFCSDCLSSKQKWPKYYWIIYPAI